jgi:hypothetical protein
VPAGRVGFRYSNKEIGSGSSLDIAEDGTFRYEGVPLRIPTVVTFTRGFAVEGRVTNANGDALRSISIETPEPWLRFFADTLTTDADGRFRVAPGRYRICRYDDGMVTLADVSVEEGDNVDLDLQIE